jgi:hypothetical protein
MDAEFLIPISLFIVIAYIIKVISDNRVRNRLIEKGQLDESVKNLFNNNVKQRNLSSMKWGLVLIGIGLALFIGQLFPYDIQEEITIGGMFFLAGVGFLIYYFIVKNMSSSDTLPAE